MRVLALSSTQRGAASLLVTSLLCFAMVLAVAYANRNLVVEERTSANQYRSAQAFEAAEAGLEWSLARLNDSDRIAADCRPSGDPAHLGFRERSLQIAATSGAITPVTWNDAGTPAPLQAACVRDGTGWTCSCPSIAHPVLPVPAGRAPAPAFSVAFLAGPRPGLVRVVSTGCTRSSGVCAATAGAGHEASSRLEAVFALTPSLRSAPAAALTARGQVDAGVAALGAHHRDPASGGLAVHAGGRVAGSALRLTAPAGASASETLAADDPALAALAGNRLFLRHFGIDKSAWLAQPAATRVICSADCASTIASTIAAGARLLWVEGELALSGPQTLGSPEDPIALVATGPLRIDGPVAIHGIVHAASMAGNDAAAPGALVRGAAVIDGDYSGNAAPDFAHDAAILALLKTRAGSFTRINGSWKDF
jgi:hypothetical protein